MESLILAAPQAQPGLAAPHAQPGLAAPHAQPGLAESERLISDDQKIVDQIYTRIKASIYARRITVAGVTILVTMAMTAVEAIATLTGEQKKALVIHVITRLTDEIPAGQEDRDAIRAAVALLLPSMIDAIVAAASGKYSINVAERSGCCRIC